MPIADQLGDAAPATELAGAILQAFGAGGALPVYPPPHHCNRLGLGPLGAHAVEAMVDRRLLVDVDHMSVLARQQALDVLEAGGYPGVLSSHSWSTPDAYPRILAAGGFVAPYAGGSTGFARAWRDTRAVADDRFHFGLGYGADSNGLGAQGGPRADAAANPVTYPFVGLGGVVVDRQVSGQRVYDVNVDGVAHYGLYPDWVEDLRRIAGDAIVDDLAQGAEAYLQTWERAVGVPFPGCLGTDRFSSVEPGMTPDEVLRAVGQPDARSAAAFTYCEGTVAFDATGRVASVDVVVPPAPAVPSTSTLPATGGDALAPLLVAALVAAGVGIRRRSP